MLPLLVAALLAFEGPYAVGLRIAEAGRERTAIWYPTADAEKEHAYGAGITSTLARDGAPSGRFPLIVFSHGYGGCAIQSVFLTEHLARAGYVVAAPDHRDALCDGRRGFQPPGRPFHKPELWSEATEADRRDDLRRLLDLLLASDRIPVDRDRIGALGHSLGGYTVAGMIGGWESWRDRRIRAGVLLSPYLQPYLHRGRMGALGVPVMFQGAQGDVLVTPYVYAPGQSGAFTQAPAPKYYLELPGGTHFEWTNFLCAGIADPRQCVKERAAAGLIATYTTAFFDAYLKDDPAPLARLRGDGLRVWKAAK